MNRYAFFIPLFLFLLMTPHAEARTLGYADPIKWYVGFGGGPTFGWNEDFNREHPQTALGFTVGMQTVTTLRCSFCYHLRLESGIGYEHFESNNFGPTQVRGTGIIGNYREALQIIHGNVGLRYVFGDELRMFPFLSFAPGIYYTRLRSVSFTDTVGRNLESERISRSSLNFGMTIGAGLTYRVSHKIDVEVYPKWHLLIPQGPKSSFFQFLLNLSYRF